MGVLLEIPAKLLFSEHTKAKDKHQPKILTTYTAQRRV